MIVWCVCVSLGWWIGLGTGSSFATYPNRADSSALAAVGILFLSLKQNMAANNHTTGPIGLRNPPTPQY